MKSVLFYHCFYSNFNIFKISKKIPHLRTKAKKSGFIYPFERPGEGNEGLGT